MTRDVPAKGSCEQHESLAIQMWAKGLTGDQVMEALKASKYIVNGVHYTASRVATGVQVLHRLNAGIKSGRVTATKAKGIAIK